MIFDVLYGFIPITEWEEQIINSPFFQRLRWIKQLGLSSYIFPGAEHNRFAHAIGVMHSMEQMLKSLDLAVPENKLQNPRTTNEATMFHKCLRIAALLHDIGTFPFSHATESAYIRHGNDIRRARKKTKPLPNNHEHLGSFIIKNTAYPGGITKILNDYKLDVQLISKIIKGDSKYLIANQLMHSDLDADRMDYLLRDAHYTGLKYGQFDRDYILSNLCTFKIGQKQLGFGIRESATHAVEDFLIARFSWYRQVIKPPGSAKFDIIATHLTQSFLKNDIIHQFQDLLGMIEKKDERFFWWNDSYFIQKCQEVRYQNLIKDPKVYELTEMLLYRRPPKTLNHPSFKNRLLQGKQKNKSFYISHFSKTAKSMQNTLDKYGKGKEWLLIDVPEKDVVFTTKVNTKFKNNPCKQRDPIKIVSKKGTPSLLIKREDTLMKHLSGFTNFTPSVFANDSAIRLLKKHKKI